MGHKLPDPAQPRQDDASGLPGPGNAGQQWHLQGRCGPICAAESAGESVSYNLHWMGCVRAFSIALSGRELSHRQPSHTDTASQAALTSIASACAICLLAASQKAYPWAL